METYKAPKIEKWMDKNNIKNHNHSSAQKRLSKSAVAKNLKREKKTPYFSPSALAVHPLSGEIYIISSPAAALVVYDKQGKFLSGVELDRGVHPQPEGMVIDKQGFLYISSEARGGIATLNIYHPLNVH